VVGASVDPGVDVEPGSGSPRMSSRRCARRPSSCSSVAGALADGAGAAGGGARSSWRRSGTSSRRRQRPSRPRSSMPCSPVTH
jgi:hypothetical protein